MNEEMKLERKKDEHFLLDLIKEIGRPLEEYARNSITSLVSVDYFFFKNVLESLSPDKAQRLYEKVWFVGRLKTFRNLNMGLGKLKIEGVSTLGKVARNYFDSRYCPLKPVEDTIDRFVGVILVCPFFIYSRDVLGEKPGSAYHKLLGNSCDSFLSLLLEEGEIKSKVEARMESAACRGDDFCRLLFQKKMDVVGSPCL